MSKSLLLAFDMVVSITKGDPIETPVDYIYIYNSYHGDPQNATPNFSNPISGLTAAPLTGCNRALLALPGGVMLFVVAIKSSACEKVTFTLAKRHERTCDEHV